MAAPSGTPYPGRSAQQRTGYQLPTNPHAQPAGYSSNVAGHPAPPLWAPPSYEPSPDQYGSDWNANAVRAKYCAVGGVAGITAIFGIICGIWALIQIKKSQERGR